ncbi:MAG: hypothetical protein KDC75_18510, partial [Phaeodactylibacter sp.]|nr:hypothetical protein [Phaeodactylibacter sp.]
EKSIELSRAVDIEITIYVNKEDHWIANFNAEGKVGETPFYFYIAFFQNAGELPGLPEEALSPSAPALPLFAFLLQIPQWGWDQNRTHGPWAQKAIKLIKEFDVNKHYTEIYDDAWSSNEFTYAHAQSNTDKGTPPDLTHHPIVVGAAFEDENELPWAYYDNFYFKHDDDFKKDPKFYFRRPFVRDYFHFGGEDLGLKYQWYFPFRELIDGKAPNRTCPGDRYYSARDWGFGGSRIQPPDLNRLTFTQAILQYHKHSQEGKRSAYLMLGHVSHLLQDVGHPDHARLADHAGSGKDEWYIYQFYCPLIAAEVALISCLACNVFCLSCSTTAGAIALSACLATVSGKEVGYEKLIGQYWPKPSDEKNVQEGLEKKSIQKYTTYDDYFKKLAHFSNTNTAFSSVVGCKTLSIAPFVEVPGLDPDIDTTNTSETKPYFDLTNQLAVEIIRTNAGLIQHFFEIVNYPPFLQRLAIAQWEPNAHPKEFAVFDYNQECRRYDAKWVRKGGARQLQYENLLGKLSPGWPAYFFLQFGPADIGPEKGRRMNTDKLQLKLTGTNPFTGAPIEEKIPLFESLDGNTGYYYWGSYLPENCSKDPYTLYIEVNGTDIGAHLQSRTIKGEELDTDPAVIPYVDIKTAPGYNWKNYMPGSDYWHQIQVAPLEWFGLSATPMALHVSRKGQFILEIRQKSRNCQWEELKGFMNCPVIWQVETKLKKVTLEKSFEPGKVKLKIEPDRGTSPPGIYTIKVTGSLGYLSQIVILTVDVH